MKKMITLLVIVAMVITNHSCSKEELMYETGDMSVCVEAGEGWLHNYPLFLGINKKNPPQIAIWLEDYNGQYLTTLYASKKIAQQEWVGAHGNTRKEALPYWTHQCGKLPLIDGMSGATPQKTFDVRMQYKSEHRLLRVMIEVNHSIDWNDAYPENAESGAANYSGGNEGSGQPALIYEADVDLDSDSKTFEAMLIGHSSPDGTDGYIHHNMDGITSALTIVKRITIHVK
ncbi:MAG: DUF2271 domain-containing protein [Bacteroidales bacterium]|nr:DUF2271 domain-containing protein [Bacteroidales bacterium]